MVEEEDEDLPFLLNIDATISKFPIVILNTQIKKFQFISKALLMYLLATWGKKQQVLNSTYYQHIHVIKLLWSTC